MSRHARAAAVILALGALAPAAGAQQRPAPGADVPRLLVGTFHTSGGAEARLGVEAAEAARERIQRENPLRVLWVLPRRDINNQITASGYPADTALSVNELRDLARAMRAGEIIVGTVSPQAGGVRIEAALVLARDASLVQPFPAIDVRNVGDAARTIEDHYSAARRQLPDNQRCENFLREQKYDDAVAAANEGIRKYPNATLARLCLMTAYSLKKLGPDSVLRVTEEILRIDPRSRLALGNAIEAYEAKGDTTRAIQASIQLWRADPSNQSLIQGIINKLASMGRPDIALPIIADLLKDNPADPQLLRTRWLLLLASRDWKGAIAAGDEYANSDTSAATADFFTRQAAAAAADSQPQLASQIAARAVQKFPDNAPLHMLYATTLRRAGQLQQAVAAAQRAVAVDANVEQGYPTIVVTFAELGQADSAIVWGQRAIAAGANRESIGQALLAPVGTAVRRAQETKTRPDWQTALRLAQRVDSVAASANTKFFIGVAAFQVGYDALQNLNTTRQCAEARLAEDMWTAAQLAMPQGASVNTETAGQIMGAIQQYMPYIAQAKRSLCR